MMARLGLVVAMVLGAVLLAIVMPQPSATERANALSHASMHVSVGDRLPSLLLTDQRGRPFLLRALRGEAVILALVCTRCRDAARCAGISGRFAYLQHRLPRGIRLVEITFDPARDTSEVLARYGRRFGADAESWTLATASDLASTAQIAGAFGVRVSGSKTFDETVAPHVDRILLLDPHGRIADVLDDGGIENPDKLLAQARVVAGLSVNPSVRLESALRRLRAVPPRDRHAVDLIAFAVPAGIFLIATVIRSLYRSVSTRSKRLNPTA